MHNHPAIVTIEESWGRVIRAHLRGARGLILASEGSGGVELLIRRATAGEALKDAYEPAAGYVRARIIRGNGVWDPGVVDLRGAKLLSFE